MKKSGFLILALAAAASAASLSGCVSHKKYNLLQADYNASQIALAERNTKIESLEKMLDGAKNANQELRSNYAALQKSLDQSLLTNQ